MKACTGTAIGKFRGSLPRRETPGHGDGDRVGELQPGATGQRQHQGCRRCKQAKAPLYYSILSQNGLTLVQTD